MELLFANYSSDEETESPKFRGDIRVSYMDFSEITPPSKTSLPIRVSSRNHIIREKLSLSQSTLSPSITITSSCIARFDKSPSTPKSPNSAPPQTPPPHNPYYSCFLLYIIGPKHLRYTIAETELKYFRSSFTQMLQKSDACHEAHFGLGKLLSYTSEFSDSQKHLKKALTLNPEEPLYQVWLDLISDWVANKESDAPKVMKKDSLLSNI